MKKYVLKILGCLLVISCTSQKEDFKNRTVESIYKKANSLLKTGEYTEAASEFKDIETLFPYSSRASEGQILAAYCYFCASNYLDATREIEVFLRYHPSHELVPYAMYLRAMCIYVQVASVGRDSKVAIDAKHAFIELANKFPNSKYAQDSLKRVVILDDIIAAHEVMIGRYYQKNKSFLSAISRYIFVISQLPHTNYAKEALYRIVECCNSLGLYEDAKNINKILETEHANSSWTKKAKLLMKKN
ncbi:MAG: outer membrane protein assembly factor BamD [Holosporaceae bacterium]|jgi:outer membrane protein assembly factor BamD|nr:outer membrane protein assembly factor BamD [Holosporaceae bacterium]